jgi:hypothetical protein
MIEGEKVRSEGVSVVCLGCDEDFDRVGTVPVQSVCIGKVKIVYVDETKRIPSTRS